MIVQDPARGWEGGAFHVNVLQKENAQKPINTFCCPLKIQLTEAVRFMVRLSIYGWVPLNIPENTKPGAAKLHEHVPTSQVLLFTRKQLIPHVLHIKLINPSQGLPGSTEGLQEQ